MWLEALFLAYCASKLWYFCPRTKPYITLPVYPVELEMIKVEDRCHLPPEGSIVEHEGM
jgi:hypothetical protein